MPSATKKARVRSFDSLSGRLVPLVSETLDQAMRMEFAGVSGPAPVKINKLLLRITAMASGRAFVGPKLWHEEEYIDNAINFTTDFMMAVASVAFLPVWLRPILSPIMPLVRALHRRIQSEKKLMYPVVLSRRELGATMGSSMKPDDLLEWLIDNTAGAGDEDDMSIIHKQMVTSFAAVHTSSQTMTNMLVFLGPLVTTNIC